jgi:hypothetical protein
MVRSPKYRCPVCKIIQTDSNGGCASFVNGWRTLPFRRDSAGTVRCFTRGRIRSGNVHLGLYCFR